LKGSTTLRTASQPFSLGVSGLTCGPLVKRIYQLIVDWGGQGAGFGTGWAPAGGGFPAAGGIASEAALTAGQGRVAGAAAGAGVRGCGASGSDGLGGGACAKPACTGIAARSRNVPKSAGTRRLIVCAGFGFKRLATHAWPVLSLEPLCKEQVLADGRCGRAHLQAEPERCLTRLNRVSRK
jgi:hypothetical protein